MSFQGANCAWQVTLRALCLATNVVTTIRLTNKLKVLQSWLPFLTLSYYNNYTLLNTVSILSIQILPRSPLTALSTGCTNFIDNFPKFCWLMGIALSGTVVWYAYSCVVEC